MDMQEVIKARCREIGIGPIDLLGKMRDAGYECISYHTVYSWWLGNKRPRHEVVPALAKVLGLTIDQLYGVTK